LDFLPDRRRGEEEEKGWTSKEEGGDKEGETVVGPGGIICEAGEEEDSQGW